jgi:hypothetical protein
MMESALPLSVSWGAARGAAPEGTVLCTAPKGDVPRAASGGGGAAAGQGGE